jgi:hypothetical protein
LLLALALVAQPAAAQSLGRGAPSHAVRTTDTWLRYLVDEGMRTSGTFRGLVERLRGSDVVVYLERAHTPRARGGRLHFVSSVGGRRYLLVRVASAIRDHGRLIALIGHELQHAVEIAAAPAVVDPRSLSREYERIGYSTCQVAGTGFDSHEAVRVGYQILGELIGADGE